jgi:phospholipid transport system substrate-binding protein
MSTPAELSIAGGWLTRRSALVLLALPLLVPAAQAQSMDAARAASFIQATGEELVAVLNSDAPVATRREQVAAILRRAVDVEGTGRFILGRWWRVATPEEQREYLNLFEQTLIRNLSARFGDFQGVRFIVGRSQGRSEDDVLVTTTVERPQAATVTLDWRVAEVGGQPRIVDLVAEGASLRLTQRSEYSSVITRSGNRISALLDAMRDQIARMG